MKGNLKTFLSYISVGILSTVIILVTFKIFEIDLSIPLNYRRDAYVHYNFAKNIEETGWWLTNPKLGAPLVQKLYDFPLSENINLLIIKLLILVGFNWVMSINIFYILTYPLTALVSLWIMKKFEISDLIAIPLSIIYTFTPFHLFRGVDHLFLSAYYLLPLSILVAYKLSIKDLKHYPLLLLYVILLGSAGAYYTFFSAIVIGTGFVIGLLDNLKDKKFILKGLATLFLLVFTFILNISPSLTHDYKYGRNYNVTVRPPSHTERYGLKLTQLILPIENHNFDLFNKIRKKYKIYGLGSITNENQYSSLGTVTSMSFILLLFWSIFKPNKIEFPSKIEDKLDVFGKLNLVSLLYATIGGLGLIVSVYFISVFRSLNRISILIAFISLAAGGLVLENFEKRRKLIVLAVWAASVFSLYDQISPGTMRNFINDPDDYSNIVEFSQTIEQKVGKGGMVFVLPYHTYPEGDDRHVVKYSLITNNISWSAASSSWRSSNYWQYNISKLDAESILNKIIKQGFNGLLVYKPALSTEKFNRIEKLIQNKPVVNSNEKFYFFNLETYAKENKIKKDPQEIFYHISGNCYSDYTNSTKKITKYWCVDNGYVVIENTSNEIKKVNLSLTTEIPKNGKKDVRKELSVSPGVTKINLNKFVQINGVFPKPFSEKYWPSTLDYPNFIIHSVKIN